jgi:hypothetical protein
VEMEAVIVDQTLRYRGRVGGGGVGVKRDKAIPGKFRELLNNGYLHLRDSKLLIILQGIGINACVRPHMSVHLFICLPRLLCPLGLYFNVVVEVYQF